MTRKKTIYFLLYWTLPLLFLLWQLLLDKMPFVRDSFPQDIRASIVDPPRSLAEAIAFKLMPLFYVLEAQLKYVYISVCFLLRKDLRTVLILTIIPVVIFLAIDYALYLPFVVEAENYGHYQVRLYHFIIGIIAECPFYLCVYYLIRQMNTLALRTKFEAGGQ